MSGARQFRRKAEIVEALRYDGNNGAEVMALLGPLAARLVSEDVGLWFTKDHAFAGQCWMEDEVFRREYEPAEPLPAPSEWVSVEERLPPPGKKNELSAEFLIWPRDLEFAEGAPVGATAYYGKRATSEPNFYKYGAVVHGVTHWRELPPPPGDAR